MVNGGDYIAADDDIFEIIMEYNLLAIQENTYLSSALDLTT